MQHLHSLNKTVLNYVNLTDGKQLRKRKTLPELLSMLKNLVEFAPAGAKKVQSFSSATCAAKKILLRLQVWNLCAGGAQIMRAADCSPFVKK